MKIHIPNSAFIGNINAFIKLLDFSNKDSLYITANKHWMSVHPVVLCMIASLGVKIRADSSIEKPILCDDFFWKREPEYRSWKKMLNLFDFDSRIFLSTSGGGKKNYYFLIW